MARPIAERVIEEVRLATEVVDLISGYVTLKKKGQNYFGLCPFHNEKTPSFSVNPEKQIFHCFGCSAGGNAFTFIMKHEGTSFPDTVKFLGQRAGIQIDFEEQDEGQARQNEALFHINEFAVGWYREMLLTEQGKRAHDYLLGRGLTSQDIETYGVGYAPPGWDNLLRQAQRTANDEEALLQVGLILEKEEGRRYDRFRDRIMFPIWNLSGRVVAFGGRILQDKQDAPKYVNSPESAIYLKGKLLYGLFQNRDEIRKQDFAVFVEGYMDFLSLASVGIRNAVATSGTSLTEDQARLILRYTRNVTLMYDSDSAGSAAALRGADVLIEQGLQVLIAKLPDGHDPDSYIREQGAAALRERLEQALPLFDFKLNQLTAQSPEQRSEGIRSLLESLARMRDRIQRSLLLSDLAGKLHISEKILWTELETVIQKKAVNASHRVSTIAERLTDLSRVKGHSRSKKAMDDLVRILIHDWSVAEFVFNHIELEEVKDSDKLPILTYFRNQFKSEKRPSESELLQRFSEVELAEFIVGEVNKELPQVDFQRWAADCIAALKKEKLQQEIATIREDLKQTELDAPRRAELLGRCIELENEKKNLF